MCFPSPNMITFSSWFFPCVLSKGARTPIVSVNTLIVSKRNNSVERYSCGYESHRYFLQNAQLEFASRHFNPSIYTQLRYFYPGLSDERGRIKFMNYMPTSVFN
jgi:hypothetical protein